MLIIPWMENLLVILSHEQVAVKVSAQEFLESCVEFLLMASQMNYLVLDELR
jgi:hypothetical protein